MNHLNRKLDQAEINALKRMVVRIRTENQTIDLIRLNKEERKNVE